MTLVIVQTLVNSDELKVIVVVDDTQCTAELAAAFDIRSEVSLHEIKSDLQEKEEISVPLDVLKVKILNLRTPDEDPRKYSVKVMFFDQTIINKVIQSVGGRVVAQKKTMARGVMTYDPSDYEKMCSFVDYPLFVSIQLLKEIESISSEEFRSTKEDNSSITVENKDFYCCNIDILTLFIGQDKLCITKSMEPVHKATGLQAISWNNLPQVTIELRVTRNKANIIHHKVLSDANIIKITLIGAYNMFVPFEDQNVYMAATKIPVNTSGEMDLQNCRLITFNEGYKIPKRFTHTNFYPQWESLRSKQSFTKCDQKFECEIEDLTNDYNIDLRHYLNNMNNCYMTIWGSFHRSLMLNHAENWLRQHLRCYSWPFEVHAFSECGGYSFMAFLDLFRLLYPGENVIRLVTPLQWMSNDAMINKCGCDLLTAPNDKISSMQGTIKKPSKITTDSAPTSTSTELGFLARPTGGDDTNAFIIVEVKLARPLYKPMIPPHISFSEINEMLKEMEVKQIKRECTGRGQLKRDWQYTIMSAANSLRRIPYYGMTDICAINRQLSETRNRVEMVSSFWQEAAIYVNNNFVVQNFLFDENLYEEMLMMSHACLMRTAYDALVGVDDQLELDSMLKAARHARQLKDVPHAVDLFLQLTAERSRDANVWREMATCLKEMDRDWANVCINKSFMLNPRHPLTLFSKACMVFEEEPDAAEPFFLALLALYPFWLPMWVAINAYYLTREMYEMAQEIMECIVKTSSEGLEEENKFPRTWEQELGDWWDHTPLLPGTSLYYEAADLLLRIRAISLAEVCIARALCQSGETAAHCHLVALCCRLTKSPTDALCHLQLGIAKFGDISYLRSLEAECHHKLKNIPASTASFEKAGACSSAYSILLSLTRRDSKRTRSSLVDLIRRQPSAYAWMALADNWMMQNTADDEDGTGKRDDSSSSQTIAAACAVQALKLDRFASRAWALLAKLVKPNARRQYCKSMAIACGYNKWSEGQLQQSVGSQQSVCYRLGTALRECRCDICEHLTF